MQLLGCPGGLLRCLYVVVKVPGVVARVLLGYPGWFLRWCCAVTRVPRVFAKVLLCGC